MSNDGSYPDSGPQSIAVSNSVNLEDPTALKADSTSCQPIPIATSTPLPMAALSAIGVALFTNSLIITVLFPFAPLVVTEFGVTEDESQVGYYAGLLASCLFIGSMLSGPIWGHISDIVGRKTVMLIGLSGNMVFSLLFGFSTNFPMAVSTRFILGLVCTVLVVSKTSITELCDDSNMAQGFSVYGLCWGLGLITGPLVGGFLVQPVVQYPWLFSSDGVFGRYPFLLPNLVLSLMTVSGIILCALFLEETLGKAKAGPAPLSSANGSKEVQPPLPFHRTEKGSLDGMEKGKLDGGEKGSTGDVGVLEKFGSSANGGGVEGGEGKVDMDWLESDPIQEEDPGLFKAFFSNRETMVTLAILCIAGFMFTGFEELFPLWALTDWDLGGLAFTSANVGLAQGASGLTLIPVTLFLYPWLINKLGAVGALQLSLFTGIFQAAIPLVRFFGNNRVVLQAACMVIFAIRSFNETGMAAMFILFNNSIRYPKYLGVLNGAQTTGLSMFQAFAPWTIGSAFAWSISSGTDIVDYHFAWFILGALHIVALAMTFALPQDINNRRFQSRNDPPLH